MNAADLITEHEGRRIAPYLDSLGVITWGIGRNVQEVPFSADEASLANRLIDLMFANDVRACRVDLLTFPWFSQLNEPRQAACMDLRFNLGPNRFRGFRQFLAAMARGDYTFAMEELEDSRWFTQVGRRGTRICQIIKSGEWPT